MSARSILMLGGSRQQVVAIERAKSLGLRTVLCDCLPDNPGRLIADSYYSVSTTDRDAVLAVAREEQVSGVLAYATDPAASTAAYVAHALGLPTNPPATVATLSEKHLFRRALVEAGMPCPGLFHFGITDDLGDVTDRATGLKWPVVIKPSDASGSKGVTVLSDPAGLAKAVLVAGAHSRNGILVCEEYVRASFPHVIGGDVYVENGQVRLWGLMSCLRDKAFPLVPVGKKTPPGLSHSQARAVCKCVQALVTHLGVMTGELNVEVILAEDDVPYVLELGARAGGNMIPVQLSDASGFDLVSANVLAAVGEDPEVPSWDSCSKGSPAIATCVLHASRPGVFCNVELSPEAEAVCYRRVMYAREGDVVRPMGDAGAALGILFLRFGSAPVMDEFLSELEQHVRVVVE